MKRLGLNSQGHLEIYIGTVLTALLACFGCTTPQIDGVLLETQLQAGQRSIAEATKLEAERFAKNEFDRAGKLLALAHKAHEEKELAQSAEFGYQAELTAQVAAAKARQHQAQQNLVNTREQQYEKNIQIFQHELEIERIRHDITKIELANALKAVQRSEHKAGTLSTDISELNDSLRRMELRLPLSEAELLVHIAQQNYSGIAATAEHERAASTIAHAFSLIVRGEFTEAEKVTTDAQNQANGLYELAIKKRNTEIDAKRGAQIAIAKAEWMMERAQHLNGNRHAPQQFKKANSHLKRAKLHLGENQYEQARSSTEQAQKNADETVAISEIAEYRQRAQREWDAITAEAEQVINSLKAEIAHQAKTQVPNLEPQLYKLAVSAFATAQAALKNKDYAGAKNAVAESSDYLQRAIANAQAKGSIKANLLTASKRIANASVIEQKDDVLIRINGALFATGSTQLNKQFFPTFTQLAKVLQTNDFRSYTVRIEAHTDTTGPAGVNQNISVGRAKAVKEFLISEGGIDEKRLTAIGLGETQPITTNGKYMKTQNSRIDIIIKIQE